MDPIRQHLLNLLDGGEAHVDFAAAIEKFPAGQRGAKPPGAPYSAWQLLEHLRIAQEDIIEFSRNGKHVSPPWPEGYWPKTEAPPDDEAWGIAVDAFQKDAAAFRHLITDSTNDLLAPFPHGSGQTLLREALLLADHNSYHIGQLVLLRKLLGDWDR